MTSYRDAQSHLKNAENGDQSLETYFSHVLIHDGTHLFAMLVLPLHPVLIFLVPSLFFLNIFLLLPTRDTAVTSITPWHLLVLVF